MPKEIYPSSYECDCGHVAHFFEHTVAEVRKRSLAKRQWLSEGEGAGKHIIVFERGGMTDVLCAKQGHHEEPAPRHTAKQGQYLAFIRHYTVLRGTAPSEADMRQFFRVSPPSVHQMVLALEKKGLIRRTPGEARSIKVLVPAENLPPLTKETP